MAREEECSLVAWGAALVAWGEGPCHVLCSRAGLGKMGGPRGPAIIRSGMLYPDIFPPQSRQVLPSGLDSLVLQVGQFAREDQEAPRKEKRDTWKNFSTRRVAVARGLCVAGREAG